VQLRYDVLRCGRKQDHGRRVVLSSAGIDGLDNLRKEMYDLLIDMWGIES